MLQVHGVHGNKMSIIRPVCNASCRVAARREHVIVSSACCRCCMLLLPSLLSLPTMPH